ncbi:hypothetical protein TNCV_1976541 [Trichonephila clavipes]|nr:hypothetical protein TNCV_1976541 [Trichonephila clavipes]
MRKARDSNLTRHCVFYRFAHETLGLIRSQPLGFKSKGNSSTYMGSGGCCLTRPPHTLFFHFLRSPASGSRVSPVLLCPHHQQKERVGLEDGNEGEKNFRVRRRFRWIFREKMCLFGLLSGAISEARRGAFLYCLWYFRFCG